MRFVSTRGAAPAVSLSEAMLAGLAPDGGLYVPERMPVLAAEVLEECIAACSLVGAASAATDAQVAAEAAPTSEDPSEGLAASAQRVLEPWFDGDRLAHELPAIVAEAFSFPAPLVPHGTRTRLLELFHGPTAAFKDFGARFLAACLTRLRAPDDAPVTILVATSGDTGSAVAAAFHHLPGMRVVVLYPDGGVSPRQAHQLGCFGDNVHAFRVAGSFDDCQRLVKLASADAELRARVNLGSANSINVGRLLPQMAWFAHVAFLDACKAQAAPGFVVPTGNLGHGFAALLARAMGVPIGPVLLATNANRTVPDWLARGVLRPRPSVATLANAMDVGNPSNAERLAWLLPDPGERGDAVAAEAVDDDAIRQRIVLDGRTGVVCCPHTSCALEALARQRARGDQRPWCVPATAHPAKFDTVVEPLLGRELAPPAALSAMLARPAHAEPLAADAAALRARLLQLG